MERRRQHKIGEDNPASPPDDRRREHAGKIAQTVQKVIQDLVAPDVRELKTLVQGLQQQMDQRFDAQKENSDAQFKALMAALGEFKAQVN